MDSLGRVSSWSGLGQSILMAYHSTHKAFQACEFCHLWSMHQTNLTVETLNVKRETELLERQRDSDSERNGCAMNVSADGDCDTTQK